jgi:hypothetical protein
MASDNIINAPIVKGSLFDIPQKKQELTLAVEKEEADKKNEIILDSDQLESQTRHILIAATAFGTHQLNEIAVFAGCTVTRAREVIKEKEKEIQDGIHCLTKGELVAKLSILATRAGKDADKLTAIKMLMDFRGLSAPEGGSRSFKRTVMKFATGG